MSWYRTGTASIANGATAVTGVLTAWAANAKAEDAISFDGGDKWYEIAAVNSNTSITLASAFGETTVSGGAYVIERRGRRWSLTSELNATLTALLASVTHILAGSGAPSDELGANGDVYFDTVGLDFYGPKAGGEWPAAVSLNGNDGADGNTILYGTAAPTTEGVDGDFYIRTTTNYIYGPKAAGSWPAGTSLIGLPGADGETFVWQSAWLTATAYVVNDTVENDGSSYICTSDHTSGAGTEPGVGGSWATVWDLMAAKGADGLGSGDVTAASAFANDNRLVRSDGTDKGVQATGISVSDTDFVTGVAGLTIEHTSNPTTAINVYQESGETTRFASTVIRGSDTGASHSGNERTLYAVEHRPVGSGTNGPTHADYGQTISVIKQDFDGSPAVGEIDGQLVVVRQGGTGSDAAAHLVNIAHYGTGFTAVLEGVSSLISASTDYSVRVQIGVVDNVTNLHYGYSTVADVGANDYAYYVANETGASWAYLFYGLTDNVNVFHVTNNGVIKSYRDNSAGTASLVLEQDGTGDIIQQFVLTGTRAWELGIDNSDSDKFKWSPVADAFASAVASLTTAGAFAVNSSVAVGVAGTTTGTFSASGSTSGTATITAQAAAGTPTLTLPNASGTFAVSGTAPIAVNATTGAITITSADAWSAYTPGAVTSSSGTITTASATGRYIQHGKTVYFKLTITVTTNGTGSGVLQVANGLPVAPRGGVFDKFHGGNLTNSTSQWAYNQSAGSQSLYVINYTAAYPVSGDGQTIIVDGTYEAA